MLAVTLDASSEIPLFHQLYAQLRDRILRGSLPPRQRLPSSRTFARDLGVSRTTVLNAFDQLLAEGYLEARVGDGTRVATTLPEPLLRPARGEIPRRVPAAQGANERPVQRWIGPVAIDASSMRPLQPGNPDLAAFPRRLWARLTTKHWQSAPARLLGYGDSMGYEPLRATVAEYAHRIRGVECRPEQVLIVGGSQQALYLCGQVLLMSGDVVWVEDPGYPGARAAFEATTATIVPIPIDSEGLSLPARAKNRPAPRLIYVTPSHQCPLGITMSLPRRLELLDFASRTGAWIVEDDYDSEYRYFTRPIASLQSLDPNGRTIYIGTLSKTLLPTLRIGYLILPKPLVESFSRARAVIDRQPAGIEQAVLADFIARGSLERHIRQTRLCYAERERALVEAIRDEASDVLEVSPAGAGMYLTAFLRTRLTGAAAAAAAEAAGVTVVPLARFAVKPLRRDGLVLGYGAYSTDQIQTAITALARALRSAR